MSRLHLRWFGWLLLVSLGSSSTAAAECRIRYQYSITAEHQPMLERTLDEGESLHLAQARLMFVENIGRHPVRLFISGGAQSLIVLPVGAREPSSGVFLLPTVQLVNVTCPFRPYDPHGRIDAAAAAAFFGREYQE